MDNNINSSAVEQLTFADVLRMFQGKLKTVICITLIAAVIGAAVGVWMSFSDVMYGAEISFYITPKESSQALLPILRSESFAEKLLLDENGLPPKDECNESDYNAALDAVKEENAAREENLRLYKKVSALPYSIAIIEKEYNRLASRYNELYDLLNMYKSATSDLIASQPDHALKIAEYEAELAAALEAKNKYKAESYDPAIADKAMLEQEYFIARRALVGAREKSEELVEKVLVKWRKNAEVKELIKTIQASVSYEYIKTPENNTAAETAENQNASFLSIKVAVNGDRNTAAYIVDRVKLLTPNFVEKNIERLMDTPEAKCTLTSTFAESHDVSETSFILNTAIYTAIAAILGLMAACAAIIVKSMLPEELTESKKDTKS